MSGGRVDIHVEADIEFLDAARSAADTAVRKLGVPARLGIISGDRVLEIGPGTGEDLQRLVETAGPGGFGIGVDVSAGIAVEARRRAGDRPNVTFVVADARHLPFRDASFEKAYLERVLQHVPQVETALAELYRVVSAGGVVLAFEPDQELRAIDHPDRDTEAELRRRLADGYVNPTIGRRLFGLLTEAGFDEIAIDGSVSQRVNPDVVASVAGAVAGAVEDGSLSMERGDAYVRSLQQKLSAGTLFSIWIAFEAHARKPLR